MLKTIDFTYDLPDSLIAQYPLPARDSSRLLLVPLNTAQPFADHRFSDICSLLAPGDLLVCNDTKVIPARLFCHRSTGASIELLFTQRIDSQSWYAIGRPMRRLDPGTVVTVDNGRGTELDISPGDRHDNRRITLKNNVLYGTIDALLEAQGVVPLPPYIERRAEVSDRENYQTVFARNPGAVAAPTAGLHFTDELLKVLENKGIEHALVTLHVGIGTFRPVTEENPEDHPMHYERYDLPEDTVNRINETRTRGGRVIAVGTTTVRVLESCFRNGRLEPGQGETNLFILPGFQFNVVNGLITNFHLPGSTLLMLVAALAGRGRILKAYAHAVARKYRFFSYGDAMVLL